MQEIKFQDLLVRKALEFAQLSLAGQKRKSGEKVVDHCLKATEILRNFKIRDPQTLAVAILHHSLSDGAANLGDIRKEFGDDVASMIDGIEKLRIIKIRGTSSSEEFIENLRRMFLALAVDLRVVLVKLADILDNLTTLQYLEEEKKKEVAQETLEIFAPLAERLGMGEMKGRMQDLAFMHLYPREYQQISKLLKTNLPQVNKTILKIKAQLKQALESEKIDHEIAHRAKHLYSLYTKLKRPEIDFDVSKVYDLIAFRVVVETVEDCYRALGIIHRLWKPSPNIPIRDYIANPKPNGYRSIHTTVFGPGGKPFEIQIRTKKMHEEAEYGLAAHWNYAEKKATGVSDEQLSRGFAASAEKLDWVKSLTSWQKEITDNQEFLKTIKTDFFGQRIFVFTPKGDVKDLPWGATPIDFAYQVHTKLGDLATGAKVNSKLVPLNVKLKNGDVVEIVVAKDKHKKPNRDWLNFVMTATARKQIKKAYLKG